jgi:hypothetical protein
MPDQEPDAVKVARPVMKQRCPQAIEASTLIKLKTLLTQVASYDAQYLAHPLPNPLPPLGEGLKTCFTPLLPRVGERAGG